MCDEWREIAQGLMPEAVKLAKKNRDNFNVGLVHRKLHVGYSVARIVVQEMEKQGMISTLKPEAVKPRKVFI